MAGIKKKKTTVSVAMTTYNGQAYILEQLQSIYDQSHPVDEVVICDDGSTDETVELVKEFIASRGLASWTVVVNERQLGFCDNFWKAITKCSGSFVFLSDQDDVWYPNKVAEMLSVMTRENALLVASSHDICDTYGKIDNQISLSYARLRDDATVEEITLSSMIGRSFIRGCSVLFRKEILADEELVSLSNGLGHDWYIISLAALKGRALFYNKKLFKYRVHATNTSSKKIRLNRRTASKLIKKRLLSLEEGMCALEVLQNHKGVDVSTLSLMEKQRTFLRRRSSLLNNFNLLQIFPLLLDRKTYPGGDQRTFAQTFKPVGGDIVFAFINIFFGGVK